jgi:hypothetical protein
MRIHSNLKNIISAKKIIKRLEVVRLNKLSPLLRANPNFPSSAGSERQYLELTLRGSSELIDLINVIGELEQNNQTTKTSKNYAETAKSIELRKIFDLNGSDKGSIHNYDVVYAEIINTNPAKNFDIFEIGLGTNNLDVVSNMGQDGRPGASLRSWREFIPKSSIVGCDIDSRVLFSEEQIETHHLDQTSDESWTNLLHKLNQRQFDLIIDDGLHSPFANLRTIIHGLKILKKSGIIVIEDISEKSLPVFNLLMNGPLRNYKTEIVKTRLSHLFIVRT